VQGQDWACFAGTLAVVLGAALVFFRSPSHADEHRLRREFQATDDGTSTTALTP
jgi:hypothetical protein